MIDINTFKNHYPYYPTAGELGLKYPDPTAVQHGERPGDTSSLAMRNRQNALQRMTDDVEKERMKLIPKYIKSDKIPAFIASSEFRHTFISGTFFKNGVAKETSDYSFKEFCDKCNFYEVKPDHIYFKTPSDAAKIYAEFNVKQSTAETSKIVDIKRVKPRMPHELMFNRFSRTGYEIQQEGEMPDRFYMLKNGKVITNTGPMLRIVMYVLKHDIDIRDIYIGDISSDQYADIQSAFWHAAGTADEYLKPHGYDIDALFAERKTELAKKKSTG